MLTYFDIILYKESFIVLLFLKLILQFLKSYKMPNTIEWSEEEMQLLINLRKEWNNDYWKRFERSKIPFWNEIAVQIETDLGMTFTSLQVREKFKGMIKDCNVNKILVNKK